MKKRVLKFIKDNNLIKSEEKVILGVSGGPDSMCMLDILRNIRLDGLLNFEIIVAHINHQIREESTDDEQFVENYCKKYGIKFYAKRFDGKVLEFLVYSDHTMACPYIGAIDIYRMVLKPRFRLFSNNHCRFNYVKKGTINELIKEYNIEEHVFYWLRENNMILFSTDMAFLYDLPDKDGYDVIYNKRPYKWAEKRGPILAKQKNGMYN